MGNAKVANIISEFDGRKFEHFQDFKEAERECFKRLYDAKAHGTHSIRVTEEDDEHGRKIRTLHIDSKPQFTVGDGATVWYYSDREAGTIVEVSKDGKRVVWQQDTATLLNGVNSDAPDKLKFEAGGFYGHTSGMQRYDYERNPDGKKQVYTLRKNGRWVRKGDDLKGQSLSHGRHEHYDYNF